MEVMCSAVRRRLSLQASLFTAPPMPSHGPLPWLVAKKFHSAVNPKSDSCWQRFNKFLKFLYCPPHPSVKYLMCLILGWAELMWLAANSRHLWTNGVSCWLSSERTHSASVARLPFSSRKYTDTGWSCNNFCSSGSFVPHPGLHIGNFPQNHKWWLPYLLPISLFVVSSKHSGSLQ